MSKVRMSINVGDFEGPFVNYLYDGDQREEPTVLINLEQGCQAQI